MKLTRLKLPVAINLFFVLFLTSIQTNAATALLVEPDPVKIACDLTTKQMQQGIVTGGEKRGWFVVRQENQNTELMYVKGDYKHTLTVNVGYTENTFAITYVDSTNLKYNIAENKGRQIVPSGSRRIHKRAVGWMKNLSGDIHIATNLVCYQNG